MLDTTTTKPTTAQLTRWLNTCVPELREEFHPNEVLDYDTKQWGTVRFLMIKRAVNGPDYPLNQDKLYSSWRWVCRRSPRLCYVVTVEIINKDNKSIWCFDPIEDVWNRLKEIDPEPSVAGYGEFWWMTELLKHVPSRKRVSKPFLYRGR